MCNASDIWFHANCENINSNLYDILAESSCSWICTKCGCTNYTNLNSQSLSSFKTENRFQNLDESREPNHAQTMTSMAIRSNGTRFPQNHKPVKVIHINFQSVMNKQIEFENLISSTDPDVIIGSITWLKPEIHNNEIQT